MIFNTMGEKLARLYTGATMSAELAKIIPEVTTGISIRIEFQSMQLNKPVSEVPMAVFLVRNAAGECLTHVYESALLDFTISIERLNLLWRALSEVPTVFEGENVDCIESEFLHFPALTHREEIWSWFERQNKAFLVGEASHKQQSPTARELIEQYDIAVWPDNDEGGFLASAQAGKCETHKGATLDSAVYICAATVVEPKVEFVSPDDLSTFSPEAIALLERVRTQNKHLQFCIEHFSQEQHGDYLIDKSRNPPEFIISFEFHGMSIDDAFASENGMHEVDPKEYYGITTSTARLMLLNNQLQRF